MRHSVILLFSIVVSMTGCDAFFRRSPISESEFLTRYFPEISISTVKGLKLKQQGGVGGKLFVARVEFTNAEILRSIRQLHCDRVLNVKDPDGIAKEYLDAAFSSALGPTPPTWATIPDATNVAIYTDSSDGRHRKIFIFDSLPVVFVVAGED